MPEAVELRDAATVMLVRDATDGGPGIEVFMLRRNLNSDFVGGAYVFPGGAVDPEDRHDDLEPICSGRSDRDASERLGIERGGLAYWVAAIRESFEEAGVLLAYGPSGHDEDHDGDHDGDHVVRLVDHDPETAARFAAHRKAVDHGERRLVEVCEQEGLRLAADTIYYFSHWITPEGAPRRYDTRFFVAAAPPGQVPLHDDHEVIANLWIRPEEALARHELGEFDLIFPTIRSLIAIGGFSSAADLLRHAATIDEVPAILPRIVADEGGFRIVLPWDPEYSDVVPAELPSGIPMNRLRMSSAPTSTGPSVGDSDTARSLHEGP